MNILENVRKSGINMFLISVFEFFCARISGIITAKLFPNEIYTCLLFLLRKAYHILKNV